MSKKASRKGVSRGAKKKIDSKGPAKSRRTATKKSSPKSSAATQNAKRSDASKQVSAGGSELIRHNEPSAAATAFPPQMLTTQQMSLIEGHVAQYVGKPSGVVHEIISFGIHLDVLPVEPSETFPYKTFVTMGMSAVPMNVNGLRKARAELCVVLPPDWPTDENLPDAKEKHWPIAWLKNLARMPLYYDTYLDTGHTVPNGDPAEPLAPDCKFTGWLVMSPLSVVDEFFELKAPRFKVNFFQIVPLYKEELNIKLDEGLEALLLRFAAVRMEVEQMCDPDRVNVGL